MASLPLSYSAQAVYDHSHKICSASIVGTEHLLFALLDTPCTGIDWLVSRGINRREIMESMLKAFPTIVGSSSASFGGSETKGKPSSPPSISSASSGEEKCISTSFLKVMRNASILCGGSSYPVTTESIAFALLVVSPSTAREVLTRHADTASLVQGFINFFGVEGRVKLLPAIRRPAATMSGITEWSHGEVPTVSSRPSITLPPLPRGGGGEGLQGPTPRSNWLVKGHVLMSALPDNRTELLKLVAAGVTTFVCLLECDHASLLESYYPAAIDGPFLKESGKPFINFIHFPIEDFSVAPITLVNDLVLNLVDRIHSGETILIHCLGGHGRTGTICSILVQHLFHVDPLSAMAYCKQAHDARVSCQSYRRYCKLPETEEQKEQVCDSAWGRMHVKKR